MNEPHCIVCQSEAEKVGVNDQMSGRETATKILIYQTNMGPIPILTLVSISLIFRKMRPCPTFYSIGLKQKTHGCESMLLVHCIPLRKYKEKVEGVFSLELLFTSLCDWAAVKWRVLLESVCAQWFPVSDRRGQTQPSGPKSAAHQWGQCEAEHWAFTHVSSADRRRRTRHPARHEVNLLCKNVFSCWSRLPGALAWVGTYFHVCVGGVCLVRPLVL